MSRRAAFLDRDGTLVIERPDWLTRPDQVRLEPGAGAAVRSLNGAGYAVVVLTNQSGVARGHLGEDDLASIHAELREQLSKHGARLDAIYYCPHHPSEGTGRYLRDCTCRKPGTGMLERAVLELDLELEGSVLIGDDLRDLALTRDNAVTPVLVRTGKGAGVEAEARREFGDTLRVEDSLAAAVDHWLG